MVVLHLMIETQHAFTLLKYTLNKESLARPLII